MKALDLSFGRAAAGYDAHAPVQMAMAEWLVEWLPEQRGGAALEIGAGTGLFTRLALPWRGGYVATDASAEMVERGAARLREVVWRQARAEAAPHGPWDWVISSSMLQWAKTPAEVLNRWRSVLAPGGRVLAGFYVADTLPELRGLLGDASPLEWRSADAWRSEFEAAGFEIVRHEVDERVFRYAGARELLRTLHGVGAAPLRMVDPARLLAWLRDRKGAPMDATWTFFRCESVASLVNGLKSAG